MKNLAERNARLMRNLLSGSMDVPPDFVKIDCGNFMIYVFLMRYMEPELVRSILLEDVVFDQNIKSLLRSGKIQTNILNTVVFQHETHQDFVGCYVSSRPIESLEMNMNYKLQ